MLHTGAADMGQGAHTVLAQLAAEELGVALEAVRVVRPDTDKSPDAGPSLASRQTFISGNAVLRAAEPIRKALLDTASEITGLPKGILALRGGRLFAEAELLPITVGNLAKEAWKRNRRLHADGFYAMEFPEERPPGANPYAGAVYTFATHIAKVLVDVETGQVVVEEIVAVDDAGRVVNPDGARGQVEGGCTMALGYGLMEELIVEEGRTRNVNFGSYLIPTARDVPKITVKLLEIPEPYAPYGARGLGEPPMSVTAPAIVNAIVDAIGAPLFEIPVTPERVLAAIKAKQ
jgi:CO/xanthine dehydrogenase Mo-binding subunit